MGLKTQAIHHRGVPFDFNTQQDVAEILQVVLDEVINASVSLLKKRN